MKIKINAEGFLWKNQKAEILLDVSLNQPMSIIQQFVHDNLEKSLFDYFIYYQSNRIINFQQTIQDVIYDKRFPNSRQKQRDDFYRLSNQQEKEEFNVRISAKEFLIKLQIEYVDERRTENYITAFDDSLSLYLQQLKIDTDNIDKILISGVEYQFTLDDYDTKFSEFPLDDDVIKIIVSKNKGQTQKGIIKFTIIFQKQQQIRVECERDETLSKILNLQKLPANSKLSLCQSGKNVLDKNKQLRYYGIDDGWIIYAE